MTAVMYEEIQQVLDITPPGGKLVRLHHLTEWPEPSRDLTGAPDARSIQAAIDSLAATQPDELPSLAEWPEGEYHARYGLLITEEGLFYDTEPAADVPV